MKKCHFFLSLILLFLLMMLASVPAAAQIPAAEREILEDFYLAANGDNWHRKDGWLNDGVDVCDWFGIECQYRQSAQRDVIYSLELPDNNLTGELDSRIFEIVYWRLNLSGNLISGSLDRLPSAPSQVDLSDNRFSGELPSELAGSAHGRANWYLDLSGNAFDGEVPASWSGTRWLNLAGNQLEGMPASLFDAEAFGGGDRFLNLADNQFSGTLPVSIREINFIGHESPSRWGGGLNLCWNDFHIDDPDLAGWIAERHVGGENFEQCLADIRTPLDPALSGSWFDPARSGEGAVMHFVGDDRALLYWFTFDNDGGQRWLFELGHAHELGLDWPQLRQTRGQFGQGFIDDGESAPIETRGSFRLDRLGEHHQMAERVYIEPLSLPCVAIYPPPLGCFGDSVSDRLDYLQLTELAGTQCDNQGEHQGYSGAWFNPDMTGEGFIVEILPDNRGLVYWFTYTPDGSGQQAWMIGDGELKKLPTMITPPPGFPVAELVIDTLYQPVGASYGADFDPDDVEYLEWGSLRVVFGAGGVEGMIQFNSLDEAYGSGEYDILRLSRTRLAECED